MKMKKFFAICCCILLLTGCGSTTEMSKPTESSITESNVSQQTDSSTETETSISKSSTTSTEASSPSENNTDYIKEPEITFTTVLNNEGYYEDVWDYIFYDDPSVYGEWECIGLIDTADLDAWITGQPTIDRRIGMITNLKLSSDGSAVLTYSSGKTGSANWTRGYVCHNSACPSVSRIVAKTLNNEDYLAFEHKSGDYAKNKDVFCYFIFKRTKTEEKVEIQIPKAIPERIYKSSEDWYDTVTLEYSLSEPLSESVTYYLQIYTSMKIGGKKRSIYYSQINTRTINIVHCEAHEGYYYSIQLIADGIEGEISKEIQFDESGFGQTVTSGDTTTERSDVHQYTHTFDTPAGITVVPDYTKSLNEIQNGIQPYSFYVRIYYTCPLCGHKKEVDSANFYYSFDSSYTVPFVRCGKASCPNAKSSKKVMINYYATQIS